MPSPRVRNNMLFFAAAGANQADLVENEAAAAGITRHRQTSGGIEFEATFEEAMRFCMRTRIATRVLLGIAIDENVESPEELKASTEKIEWEKWIDKDHTFMITETDVSCRWLKNGQYASMVVKDGICDRIRSLSNDERPSIDRDNPDVVFHVHIEHDEVRWYVDFSGKSLCKRGYRVENTEVYAAEHIAAACLMRSKWDTSTSLVDPFCGSGTFAIEAALMATDTDPGLISPERYRFFTLPGFVEDEWENILDESEKRSEEGKERFRRNGTQIIAWDIDSKVVEAAGSNAKAAGMEEFITFGIKDARTIVSEDLPAKRGWIVTDPPYGYRIGSSNEIRRLYVDFGAMVPRIFGGWNVSILCGEQELLGYIDMKPDRTNTIIHGGLPCQLAHYYVFTEHERSEMAERKLAEKKERLSEPLPTGAEMVCNRIIKNLAALKKPMEEENVTSFRIYDADIPEYSAAIDLYEGKWISLQEYAAPSEIEPETAERHLNELILATERATGVDMENIFVRQRSRQKGTSQYGKLASSSKFYLMRENGMRFMVNFQDYLDTGIFLDHRPVRKMIMNIADGTRFLNLFCYTGTASVYAAKGGAISTVSVDASSTYLDWAIKNFELNNLKTMEHFFYRDDCINYLKESNDTFDLIFCDPPTFSNSKSRMTFDVQRDHRYLIQLCMDHLSENGTLIFSTNFRRFALDEELMEQFTVENISASTIGVDFARDPKIHYCWKITHKNGKEVKKIKIHLK